MKQNKYQKRSETIQSLKSVTKSRGVIHLSTSNSLTHELTKCFVFYFLKKGYDIEMIESLLLKLTGFAGIIETVTESTNYLITHNKLKPTKTKRLILTEAEIGIDKIDLVLADEKLCIEIDYKHPTGKDKIKRLERKGFKVCILNL